ncbi:MAG: hypothetical protein U9O87_07300 [Verrucomicrobiota bacterium]|nr:hypothetical protein [Verrucomicrobiota bacterium]
MSVGNKKEDPKRNYVLRNMEQGMDSFQRGDFEKSKNAFDNALDEIEAVWGDDAAARKARRMWNNEGCKNFKGEPYERVMAYYYRGLLYIMDGDLENARACFRGGILQDSFSEEKQDQSDFALLYYLEMWSDFQLGQKGKANELKPFLKKIRKNQNLPQKKYNLLVIAETGHAPRKRRTGKGKYQLTFSRASEHEDTKVELKFSSFFPKKKIKLSPIEDIYWQASSRGGRPVDKILRNKVVFKEKWDEAGSAMTGLGLQSLGASAFTGGENQDTAQIVAGGLTLLGLLSTAVASKVRPEADIRQWRNLPDTVHIASAKCPPGKYSVQWKFSGKNRHKSIKRNVRIDKNNEFTLLWIRKPEFILERPAE